MQPGMPIRARPDATRWVPYLIVVLAALAVYANTLLNGWVLDDFPQILQNPWIASAQYAKEIFSSNAWAFDARESSYYRPVIQVIYMVTYYLFGLKPWAFHLVNVIVHAGVCLLVLVILLRLSKELRGGDPGVFAATIAAVLFAVHPIHTEVVAPVMGMHDLAFSFFYLLSFFLYMPEEGRRGARLAGSVAAFFVALLCKEPAVTLPLLLIGFDAVIRKERLLAASTLKRYVPYGAAIALYLAMRYHALGGLVKNQYAQADLSTYGYVINVFPLLVRYLEKLLAPVNLNLVYVYHPVDSLFQARAIFSFLIIAIGAALAWRAARKDRLVAFGCLLLVLPLLPALYLPGLNQKIEQAFAERYLYLPSCGFVALVCRRLQAPAGGDTSRARALATAAAGVLIALFSIGTVSRNADWKDNYSLWSDAVRKSPESAAAHRDLGYALLYQNRDPEEARRQFDIAVRLEPKLPEGAIRAGVAYAQSGMIDKAIFQFHAALALKPDSAEAHYNLALAYEQKGWQKDAVAEYETALRLDPRNANAHNNVGVLYAQGGVMEKAVEHFKMAVSLKPEDPEFGANLARAYKERGPDNAGR